VLGDVTSVTLGPDNTLWALHRGGAVWDAATFGDDNKLKAPKPVAADVVVQMDAHTGEDRGVGGWGLEAGKTRGQDRIPWAGPRAACASKSQRPGRTLPGPVPLPTLPPAGKILRQWGAGHFYMPHMLTVDRHGSVWVADVGRHQVLKFTAEGKLLMEVGTKLEPGDGPAHFCKPTQVCVWGGSGGGVDGGGDQGQARSWEQQRRVDGEGP
jgi:hypothetical protein